MGRGGEEREGGRGGGEGEEEERGRETTLQAKLRVQAGDT